MPFYSHECLTATSLYKTKRSPQTLGMCGCPEGTQTFALWLVARLPPIRLMLPNKYETENKRLIFFSTDWGLFDKPFK